MDDSNVKETDQKQRASSRSPLSDDLYLVLFHWEMMMLRALNSRCFHPPHLTLSNTLEAHILIKYIVLEVLFLPLHLNLFLIGMMSLKKTKNVLSFRSYTGFLSPFCSQLKTTSRYLETVGQGSASACANRKQNSLLSQLFLARASVPSTVHTPESSSVRQKYCIIQTYSFTLLVLWFTRGSVSIRADLVTATTVKSRLDVDDAVLGAVKDQAGVLTGVCGVET